MATPDGELLQRSRDGDAEAFGELVDRYKDLMVNYLPRLTGSRDRADDVAQEAFVRFYRNLDRYHERGTLVAYLLSIATNLVRSAERRRRRWELLQPLFFSGNGHRPAASPQAAVLAGEEQREVTRALAQIELTFRAPLVLREIEGLSYQEIAAAVGCNEGTVKSRLHRGRQLLRDQLEPFWKGAS